MTRRPLSAEEIAAAFRTLAALVRDLRAMGFDDPHADINGGDLVEIIGLHYPHLVAAITLGQEART